MSYQVVAPPSTQEALTEVGKELIEAGRALGMDFDIEGFLLAWVNGMRVVVERTDGAITSMAFVQTGKQWVRNKVTARVMEMRYPTMQKRDELLEFIKQIAIAVGAVSLYVDFEANDTSPDRTIYTVIEYKL